MNLNPPSAILSSPLLPIVILVVLYMADYYLTVYAARVYKAGANQMIVFDGSYELNPLFVADIERLRDISPRFIAMLLLYSIFIWAVWFVFVRLLSILEMYAFALGAILLIQGPIQVRHARNILIFRRAKECDGISGRIEYSRQLSYTASAAELLSFSGLYLILGFLLRSWLLVGGAFACAVLALKHSRLSRKSMESRQSP